MRVAIFSESYEPVQNGVSTSVRTLIDELRIRHHKVTVVAPLYPEYDDGPFVLRVPSFPAPLNIDYNLPYPWFPKLKKEFAKLDPDVIHTQSPWFLGMLGRRLAQQQNLPLVTTYHTLYNHYGHYLLVIPKPAVESLLEWWIPEYYNRCTCVIVPSKVASESLHNYGVQSRIEVIPTGVPLPNESQVNEQAKQALRYRFGIPPDVPLLLYAGRISQEKNLELVLHAFALVSADNPSSRLLIVGSGPYEDACKKIALQMVCGDKIIFAGPLQHDEMFACYAAADLFVFGSGTETQGLVIAESRATGTPAVVVNEGGAPENVQHGSDGIIVESDPYAFAAACNTILKSPSKLKSMTRACLQNAKQFTPEKMAEKVLEVYEWSIWKKGNSTRSS